MSEKKNNILIKLLAPLVAIGLFGSLCIAGLFGGSGNNLNLSKTAKQLF